MIKPTAKTCNKEVQKFTNTSYDILLELYNNTGFFKDLWEALNPGYWWDFSAGINGWQATIDTGALISSNGYAISFGGDFYNNQLNIDADKNKILSLLMETSDIGETGSIEITYDESRVVLYEDVFEYPTGMSGILVNLDGREEHSGTITGIRFILTSDINKQFNLFKIIVGKPLINVSTLIKSIGFKPDQVPFIPMSAFEGDNIKESSPNMTWYKGDALIPALDKLNAPEKPVDLPLRVPVQDVYKEHIWLPTG